MSDADAARLAALADELRDDVQPKTFTLAELPGFPCGFEEPEILRYPALGGVPMVVLSFDIGPLSPDEARGYARRILELADEIEGV